MTVLAQRPALSDETLGLLLGGLGLLAFSLTLPMTRLAVAGLDPTIVGLGRALVAAVLAAFYLRLTRQPRPTRRQWGSLALVAGGVVLGFPLLSAWATVRLPSAHGAIILGVLPLATALAGVVRAGERPSRAFWLAGVAGSVVVVGFALSQNTGGLQTADLALLGAVAAAALGYAEGGRLARELGGAQVICWALLLAAPFIALPVLQAVIAHGLNAPPAAWIGFAYVALISQFLGMFAWYRGMALAGVARVGQLQLLQPFLTLVWSAALLAEVITPAMIVAAVLVLLIVALGRRAVVRRA
ncbi:MAG: DMT family transporter [Chloroflexota bacterium]|nr:DMT family transporter [Chloroflexota bacterium]